jgi:hypothetical protein
MSSALPQTDRVQRLHQVNYAAASLRDDKLCRSGDHVGVTGRLPAGVIPLELRVVRMHEPTAHWRWADNSVVEVHSMKGRAEDPSLATTRGLTVSSPSSPRA